MTWVLLDGWAVDVVPDSYFGERSKVGERSVAMAGEFKGNRAFAEAMVHALEIDSYWTCEGVEVKPTLGNLLKVVERSKAPLAGLIVAWSSLVVFESVLLHGGLAVVCVTL